MFPFTIILLAFCLNIHVWFLAHHSFISVSHENIFIWWLDTFSCRYTQLLLCVCLYLCLLVYSLYQLDIHVIISWSIIYPGCLDRVCQHTTYCFPVWPVFLLTWCYSSHSRPAQLSIWAACLCVCAFVYLYVCVWQWPWAQCPVSCWSCAAH